MPPSESMQQCADELRDIRGEMKRGFDDMRGTLEEVRQELKEGAVQIALNSRNVEILQRDIDRSLKTPPNGQRSLSGDEKNLSIVKQTILTTAITVAVTSFVSYSIVSWARHVADDAAPPASRPILGPASP
jgi:hypothetical protein